jgi:Neprosin
MRERISKAMHCLSVAVLAAGLTSSNEAVSQVRTGNGVSVDKAMPKVGARKARADRPNVAAAPGGGRRTAEFERFVRRNLQLKFEDVYDRRVRDRAAFDEMRSYFSNRYDGLSVAKTFSVGEHTYDCIAVAEQPSLRDADLDEVDETPGSSSTELILGYPDTVCQAGWIPFERDDIMAIASFQTLQDYFSKDGGLARRLGREPEQLWMPPEENATDEISEALEPMSDGYIHRHAVIGQSTKITGLRSSLSIWNPTAPLGQMSLSQTWIVGGTGKKQQTLESGWQVYKAWDPDYAAPFIFSTTDGYQSGCYNLTCSGFVQVTNQLVFARFADERYSVADDRQTLLRIEWLRKEDNGNWWLKLNDVWVGYYPAEHFDGGWLTEPKRTVSIQFGGENTGPRPEAQMGSGAFAKDGFKKAAYQMNMFYRDLQGEEKAVTGVRRATSAKCYTVADQRDKLDPPDGAVGRFFYFGGPGLADRACARSEPPPK